MEQPVVFLAFANDRDNHLPLLDEERRAVADSLLPLANQNYLQLFVEPSARIKDIIRYVTDFKDRIMIFHFGGHADSAKLFLSDQDADAEGLANLLGSQKNLKLVFLNGCSTKSQVELLFASGVNAVIATSVPVADPSAKAFAEVFYGALGRDHSIEESFKIAAAAQQLTGGALPAIHRGIQLGAVASGNELPWGLYIKDEKSLTPDWKIPKQQSSSFIVRGANMIYGRQVSMNENLVETIANTIEPFSEKIQALVAEAKRKKRKPNLRDLRAAVIDSFPTPIGTHLRKLLLSEEVNPERLQKIVNVYSIASQMLCYVLMAQLWDEVHHNEKYHIPVPQKKILQDFFNRGADDISQFDFVLLIRALGDIFDANKTVPFVAEFEQLRQAFYENKVFEDAYRFLEELKNELKSSIDATEIESFCVQAEEKLSEIFKHIGFSAKYRMVAVKSIELDKERHKEPNFKHNIVILDRVTASFGILDEVLSDKEFVENQSVILLCDDERIKPYLNLSPFIIDENALSGQHNSKIYFLQFIDQNSLNYRLTDNLRDTLKINEQQYEQMYVQWMVYKRLVLS